jgi:hypothetical protein
VKQRSGLYPRLGVDDAGSQLVSQAGAVALVDTVRVVGLDIRVVGGGGTVAEAAGPARPGQGDARPCSNVGPSAANSSSW